MGRSPGGIRRRVLHPSDSFIVAGWGIALCATVLLPGRLR